MVRSLLLQLFLRTQHHLHLPFQLLHLLATSSSYPRAAVQCPSEPAHLQLCLLQHLQLHLQQLRLAVQWRWRCRWVHNRLPLQ